jgi:hypothetical protein
MYAMSSKPKKNYENGFEKKLASIGLKYLYETLKREGYANESLLHGLTIEQWHELINRGIISANERSLLLQGLLC